MWQLLHSSPDLACVLWVNRVTHGFVAVGAELGDRRRPWRLGMGIVACLALNIRCMMGAGAPFISGGLMAGAA